MDLKDRVLNTREDEIDAIIREAIEEANQNSTKVPQIGFLNNFGKQTTFHGFIPLDTRIKYDSNSMFDYGMQTTDFMYEFAHFLKKNDINKNGDLVASIEPFINLYFGEPGKADRTEIFETMAWKNTTTEEEFFELLDKNTIGDLKGKGAAMCTERSAVAQQLLNLFGFDSFYCMGCLEHHNQQEPHVFNIVKRKHDYALLDYSMPIPVYDEKGQVKSYEPFMQLMDEKEFDDFVQRGIVKEYQEYHRDASGHRVTSSQKRKYVVGVFEIPKEESPSKEESR